MAAEGFRGEFFIEACANGCCAVALKDIADIVLEDISECHHAIGIKAAGDDTTVGENSEMIAQPIAKYAFAVVGRAEIGPLEALAVLDMELVLYAKSACAATLEISESCSQSLDNGIVRLRRAVLHAIL